MTPASNYSKSAISNRALTPVVESASVIAQRYCSSSDVDIREEAGWEERKHDEGKSLHSHADYVINNGIEIAP
jgi:hypothetical protein